jgi:hypothetical protein
MLFQILIPVLGLTTSAPPNPAFLPVMDAVVGEGYVHSTAEFAMNGETSRAWIEATIDNGGRGDDHDRQTLRARVQDLYYDIQTHEIVHGRQGSRVVCARMTTSGFLFSKRTHIHGTGRCELPSRFERRDDDNGFERERNKHLIVELTITR